MKTNYLDFYFNKPRPALNELYFGSFARMPKTVENEYYKFMTESGLKELSDTGILNLALSKGVIINRNFSHYKTHVSISFNGGFYVCPQKSFTISYCLTVLLFLELI